MNKIFRRIRLFFGIKTAKEKQEIKDAEQKVMDMLKNPDREIQVLAFQLMESQNLKCKEFWNGLKELFSHQYDKDDFILKVFLSTPLFPKSLLIEMYNDKYYDMSFTRRNISKYINLLVNIESLYASNNDITNIPKEVFDLPKIKTLFLDDNMIEEIPPEIINSTSLEYLYLSNNNLSNIPDYVTKCKKLNTISIGGNNCDYLNYRFSFDPKITIID